MDQLVGFGLSSGSGEKIDFDPRSHATVMASHRKLSEDAEVLANCADRSARFVRQVIAARAARRRHFDADLFADPAWDILLELYALSCEQQRTSVSKLCISAGVPATTALRWIEKLDADGLVTRQDDPLDGRRVWVALSDKGTTAMKGYLFELLAGAMPL